MVARGRRGFQWLERVMGLKARISSLQWISPGEVLYRVLTIDQKTGGACLKVAERGDPESSHPKEKTCNYVWRQISSRLIVVITSQYVQRANCSVVTPKLIHANCISVNTHTQNGSSFHPKESSCTWRLKPNHFGSSPHSTPRPSLYPSPLGARRWSWPGG